MAAKLSFVSNHFTYLEAKDHLLFNLRAKTQKMGELPDAIFKQISSNLYDEEAGTGQKFTGDTETRQGASLSSSTVTPASEPVEEVKPRGKTRNVKPTTFYLTDKQLRKLDDLAYIYNGRTGKRINRNDIIRHLVDTCDISSLPNI